LAGLAHVAFGARPGSFGGTDRQAYERIGFDERAGFKRLGVTKEAGLAGLARAFWLCAHFAAALRLAAAAFTARLADLLAFAAAGRSAIAGDMYDDTES
jgi:hypothetical protein